MVRLDSMSKEELYALWSKSRILVVLGNIKMIGVYLILFSLIIVGCTAIFTKDVLFLLPGLIIFSILYYSSAYVFKYVRSLKARLYFKFWSISSIVFSGLGLLGSLLTIAHETNYNIVELIFTIIISSIFLILGIQVFIVTKKDILFGENYITHDQIGTAITKIVIGESFTDEDIPPQYHKSKLEKIYIFLAFAWEIPYILLILSFIIFFILGLMLGTLEAFLELIKH